MEETKSEEEQREKVGKNLDQTVHDFETDRERSDIMHQKAHRKREYIKDGRREEVEAREIQKTGTQKK